MSLLPTLARLDATVMTLGTLQDVVRDPSQHTPRRTFRIPEPVYQAAQAKALERGETLSDVVRRALEEYGQ